MSKKNSVIGTILALSGVAAATAVAYYKRDEIRTFLEKTAERYFPASCDEEEVAVEEIADEECDIVIDSTDAAAEITADTCEENEEETAGD